MKTKKLFLCILGIVLAISSCKSPEMGKFASQERLDSLKAGTLDFGSKEINDGLIRALEYQKKYQTGKTNGVVVPKEYVNEPINGFTSSGPNLPADTSNYSKWDFMVLYPGLEINSDGEEKLNPVVLYFKGTKDISGNLIPAGFPVKDINFSGGGGGDGKLPRPAPPPTVP